MLKAIYTSTPLVITVDKQGSYPKAIKELKAAKKLPGIVKLRQIKYLNNIVEQDHRGIKRLVKPGMGFGSFNAARRTIRRYEIMNMMRKKRASFGTSIGRCQRAGSLHQPHLWSNCLIGTPEKGFLSSLSFCNTTKNLLENPQFSSKYEIYTSSL